MPGIIACVLKRLRAAWPETHIVLRGDGHFSNPELMQLALADPHTDFIFGLTSNQVLARFAQPYLEANRRRHAIRGENARRLGQPEPQHTRTYHELDYAGGSWPQPFRVVLKAEVMSAGDNPRFVVTSLHLPTPEVLYRELYCARGQDENFIKKMKHDLASDRTSDHSFLANHLRLFFSDCARHDRTPPGRSKRDGRWRAHTGRRHADARRGTDPGWVHADGSTWRRPRNQVLLLIIVQLGTAATDQELNVARHQQLVECGDEGTASVAIDAVVTSPHPVPPCLG